MFKYLFFVVSLFATTPAFAANVARDIDPINRALLVFRHEMDDLQRRINAMQSQTVRVTMECVMGRRCQFSEAKSFRSRGECEKSIAYSLVTSSVCITPGDFSTSQ